MKKILLVLSLMAPLAAFSQPQIHGFGTAGAVISTAGSSAFDYGLYNIDRRLNFRSPTRVGMNLSDSLDERFSYNFQVIAKGNDTVRPHAVNVEWAQLNWEPSSWARISFGRQKLPLWLFSDRIEVGYSYHWVAPPAELYQLSSGVNSVDGVAIGMDLGLGRGWYVRPKVLAGNASIPSQKVSVSGNNGTLDSFDVRNMRLFNLEVGFDAPSDQAFFQEAMVRGVLTEAKIGQANITIPVAVAALGGLYANSVTVIPASRVSFHNLGFKVGLVTNTELFGEVASIHHENATIGRNRAAYLSALQWIGDRKLGVHATRSRTLERNGSLFNKASVTTLGLVAPVARGVVAKADRGDVRMTTATGAYDSFEYYRAAVEFIF